MRRRCKTAICFIMAAAVSAAACFAGCSFGSDGGESTPKEYTVQYTDNAGTHRITVTDGMPYSIEAVPEKTGYEFTGLFDAETGGTQYVSASGASLKPFGNKKNIVLFPQFRAKEYNVILDYEGAEITGVRQVKATYGEALPELPNNLTLAHNTFTGWYTAENCGGVQVADRYGLVPLVSVVNENNFDLSRDNLNLYAGFEVEKYTVTCHYGTAAQSEQLLIAYDTPVSLIVPETRVDGKAPLTWSKTQGGEVFSDKITEACDLYAVEYAPVIEFDVNGGNKENGVVARAGTTVTLPVPEKDFSKFLRWEDARGNEYTATTMPSESITLKAVWQAKIVFDENGGEKVSDISKAAGENIVLPTPEREGYIFAGWYTADKDQYTATKMPSAGLALKAGWYKEKTEKIMLKPDDETYFEYEWTYNIVTNETNKAFGPTTKDRLTLNLEKFLTKTEVQIHIVLNCKIAASYDGHKAGFYFYDGPIISEVNFLGSSVEEIPGDWTWRNYEFSQNFSISSNTLYICYYGKSGSKKPSGYSNSLLRFKDVWVEISYPDTTYLYL